MDKNVKIFVSVIVLLFALVGGLFFLNKSTTPTGPGKYDEFATCLKDKGAVFFGAFWCTHCQAQKKMFGTSQKLLPYVECSTPDAKGQTQECIDKGVVSYPTWRFTDGSELKGEIPLAQLAEKTSCVLPQ